MPVNIYKVNPDAEKNENIAWLCDEEWLQAGSYLGWLNPTTNLWGNAVDGDFGGMATFVSGAYDAAADFHLGTYGLDLAHDTVWAAVDTTATSPSLHRHRRPSLRPGCGVRWEWRRPPHAVGLPNRPE